jgi:hypothetical protein
MERAGQLMSYSKTYDQKTYDVLIDGNRIKISSMTFCFGHVKFLRK